MENDLRILVGLGLTLLLVMLRVEAQRFGAAEYDEPVRGRRPSVIRRLAWYILGVGGVLAAARRPSLAGVLAPPPGRRSRRDPARVPPRRPRASPRRWAWPGTTTAGCASPTSRAYPGALANEILTAFIDEAVFRGAVLGYFLWALAGTDVAPGTASSIAILGQAVMYVLATRLGAPGRDRYMFILALAIGLVGGWATLLTGGIGASFLGHAITRVAVFLTTGHAGQPPARAPRSRTSSAAAERPRAGGPSTGAAHGIVDARASAGRPPDGDGGAPSSHRVEQPPVALYVHVPFCVSHCPYCDFVVVAGREARGPANRIGAFVAALEVELELRADALDARWGPTGTGARPALDSVYLGGGTPSLLPAPTIARLIATRPRSVRPCARRRGHARGQPGTGRARRRQRAPRRRRDAAVDRRAEPGPGGAAGSSVAGTHPATSPTSVRAARDAGFESVSLDLLYDVPTATIDILVRDARRGPRARARPPLAVRADPRRSGRGGHHRAGRRSPAGA